MKVQIWTVPGIWGYLQPDCCHSGLGSLGDVAGFLLLFHTFNNFYPHFQLWSFLWDHQDKSDWNISRFKVESLDWSFTVMSLLHQPQVFLKWDCDLKHVPTLLTSEIWYGLLLLLISHVTKFNIILHLWLNRPSILCIFKNWLTKLYKYWVWLRYNRN